MAIGLLICFMRRTDNLAIGNAPITILGEFDVYLLKIHFCFRGALGNIVYGRDIGIIFKYLVFDDI